MQSYDPRIDIIVRALRKAGHNPYDQIQGYLLTGDPAYITRTDNARSLILQINQAELVRYLASKE